MKTKTLLPALLLLCLLFTGSNTSAQTPDSVFYRHHIGVNTQIAFDYFLKPDNRTPLQILYKYQVRKNTALRLAITSRFSHQSFIDPTREYYAGEFKDFNNDSTSTSYELALGLGYEWQQNLTPKWQFYIGADAEPYLDKRKVTTTNYETLVKSVSPNNSEPFPTTHITHVEHNYTTKGFRFRPFLGVRHQLGKRIYASAETALITDISRFDYRAAGGGYWPELSLVHEGFRIEGRYITKDVDISMQPISSLSIFYLF
ncbi:hypothetical protein [Pontibacter fetidus]|uniref:Outer membrane protein beta-barrel domain-containing protein n=1 Tax=Pontibacter fetidus TaxID=2700082 RepID=A0A6B2HBB7_9BACT|nr:hypothetical protein [Pontibacter fetidus]NDK57162.1 hypothetical protein [Pontibacter fetidus]